MEELINRGGDALVEPVELGKTFRLEFVVGGKRLEESSGERGVDSFKQCEKNQEECDSHWAKVGIAGSGESFRPALWTSR